MEVLDSIIKLAEDEFDAIARNGKFRSREEIDSVYKLIDIVKDINEIWCMEDDTRKHRESYRDYPRESYREYPRESYRKRDSRGRYARYSGKEEYIDHLRDMMDDAPDEQTRQSIERMISQMS